MTVYTQRHKPDEIYKRVDIFDRFSFQNINITICLTIFPKSLASVGVQLMYLASFWPNIVHLQKRSSI